MDREQKKAVQTAFKEKKSVGGVYCIENIKTGKKLLQTTPNIEAKRNSLEFSQKTNTCSILEIREDWEKFGGDVFVFSVMDELEKEEEQTRKAFAEDLKELLAIWRQKLDGENFY